MKNLSAEKSIKLQIKVNRSASNKSKRNNPARGKPQIGQICFLVLYKS